MHDALAVLVIYVGVVSARTVASENMHEVEGAASCPVVALTASSASGMAPSPVAPDSRRDHCSDATELLRYRAHWACEILTNPAPTSSRGTYAVGDAPPEQRRGSTT